MRIQSPSGLLEWVIKMQLKFKIETFVHDVAGKIAVLLFQWE